MSVNGYIARMMEAERRNGRERMLERAHQWLCSLALGRDFHESCEAFEARNPAIAEFSKWVEEQENE